MWWWGARMLQWACKTGASSRTANDPSIEVSVCVCVCAETTHILMSLTLLQKRYCLFPGKSNCLKTSCQFNFQFHPLLSLKNLKCDVTINGLKVVGVRYSCTLPLSCTLSCHHQDPKIDISPKKETQSNCTRINHCHSLCRCPYCVKSVLIHSVTAQLEKYSTFSSLTLCSCH